MNYNKNHKLWEISGNYEQAARGVISSIAISTSKENYFTLHELGTTTLIKAEYDQINKRTLVRTETFPNKDPPKELTELLKHNKFKPIKLTS